MKIFELDVIYDKQATIKLFERKIITFKWLYKFLKKVLTYNIKLNILFRMDDIYLSSKEFYKNLKASDLKKLYNNLIKDLDEDSIKTVHRIIYRIKNLYEWKKFLPYIKFFDKDEIDSYNQLIKVWKNRKIKNNILIIEDKYKFENDNLYIASLFENLLTKHNIYNFKSIANIKNKCIIDAGAWIGDSALVLSEVTDKNVYSFECTSSTYKILQRTIELNNRTNIVPIQMGLGDKVGKEILYTYSKKMSGCNTLFSKICDVRTEQPISEQINITTIDNFVEENNLEVGFIKADIEGMEMPMLKGAINTLKTQKPALCISIYHSFEDFFYIKDFIESLNLGYKFSIVHFAKGYELINETCLLAEIDK